jgi:hypothetical protein
MVIFIPTGTDNDATRASHFYQNTFDYLRSLGIPELDTAV